MFNFNLSVKIYRSIVYYEPIKNGEGGFYGYGIIDTPPFKDKQDDRYSFISIKEYKPFSKFVSYKNEKGEIIEQKYNPNSYNYNNAVRRVNKEFLDAVCLDGKLPKLAY